MTSRRRSDIAALAFILLLSLILFRDSILHGRLFSEPDTVTFYYPVMAAVDRALERNTIPLWTPYIFGGFPLFADGEAGVLYPFNLLFSWLLPIQDAFVWLTVLRFFLAGAFTYAFVRSIGGGRTGALTASMVFAFGSFMVGQLQHTNVGNSAVWLPLVLCFAELALQARGLKRHMFLLLGGVTFGIQNLGIHVQPVLMTWLVVFLYTAFRVLLTEVGTNTGWSVGCHPSAESFASQVRRWPSIGNWLSWCAGRRLAVRLGLLLWVVGVVTAIGFGLAAIQLVPLYELGNFSFRGGGVSWSFATLFSLPLYNLATLVFPYFFIRQDGSTWSLWVEWESTVYAGIAPLILAVLAACFARTRLVLFFAVLALLSLLFAFGDYLPIKAYAAVWSLPGFSVLRAPARFSYVFVFCCAVLAAVGVEWIMGRLSQQSERTNSRVRFAGLRENLPLVVFASMVFAFAVSLGLAIIYGRNWLENNRDVAINGIQESYLKLRHQNFSLNPENVCNSLSYSLDLTNIKTTQSILFLVTTALLILLWYRFRSLSRLWQGALVVMVAADLLLFAGDFHPTVSIESLSAPPGPARFIAQNNGLYRVHNKIPGMRTEPNRLLPFRLAAIGGYSSLETNRHREYMGPILRGDKRFIDLWNVRYIITWAGETPSNDFKEAYRDSDIVVYENDSYLPRAFLVQSAAVVQPGRAVLDRMQASDFNPATTVLLEETFEQKSSPSGIEKVQNGIELASVGRVRSTSQVEVLDYQREAVTIDVSTSADAFLVLTDSYYPGWKAYLDGEEVHVYRADYLFRAVRVPAGSHTVRFVFAPASFEIGRTISIATLFIVLAAAAYGAHRRFYTAER